MGEERIKKLESELHEAKKDIKLLHDKQAEMIEMMNNIGRSLSHTINSRGG